MKFFHQTNVSGFVKAWYIYIYIYISKINILLPIHKLSEIFSSDKLIHSSPGLFWQKECTSKSQNTTLYYITFLQFSFTLIPPNTLHKRFFQKQRIYWTKLQTFDTWNGKELTSPVSGLVSKCVRDFDMCLQSASNLEHRVGVRDDLRGNSVPFTCDNSRSGIKGSTQNRARSPTGLHHGITIWKQFHNVKHHSETLQNVKISQTTIQRQENVKAHLWKQNTRLFFSSGIFTLGMEIGGSSSTMVSTLQASSHWGWR